MEGYDVTLVFNGMSFTTTYSVREGGKDYVMTIEAGLSLNERGFITEMAIKMKQLTKEGTLILEADFPYLFSYNTDGQMISFGRGKLNGKQFDDVGNQINTLDQEPQDIMEFIWENRNMVKTVVVGKREHTKKYGSEVNITKQNTYERIFDETQGGYTGCSAMHLIGLLGVGAANFQQERTFTLNPNGTIATEDNYTYFYK